MHTEQIRGKVLKKGNTFRKQYQVDPEIYLGFINLFGDKNPLHTDAVFAKGKGFRDCVMHGNILGGFLSHFVGECLPVKNIVIHSQEIIYLLPVYLHDCLTLEVTVLDYFESVNVFELKFYFQNSGNEKVAKGMLNIGLL
ncbi:MAG: MaoC/PaaZ C-terminal domain-containing protein [Bacteroidia bacterium]